MSVIWEKKLVPSSGKYLWSVQRCMCRIATLGGKSPLGRIANQAAKDIKYGSTWLDMRQAQAIWPKLKVKEVSVRLKKAGKAHDNAITNGHKGVLRKWPA